ncbi:FliM/FliN family flagellar motor switch protein [Hoeflea sp.]|uniref:FliM/FliN family flagellar motor switch protein n=1 Tax=Hoeflea sp. TaxID=1940281 RepID=UPI003B019FA7
MPETAAKPKRPESMSNAPDNTAQRFDAALLQRMTGQSGDRETLESQCLMLAEMTGLSLALNAGKAIGEPIDVEFDRFTAGPRSELIAEFDVNSVVCPARIDGWCDDITLAANTVFVIAVMECMLGGAIPEGKKIKPRELSAIELDVSTILFTQFAESLKSAIADPTPKDASAGQATQDVPEPEEGEEDTPCVMLTFQLRLGSVEAPFLVVVPQRPLLKAKIAEREDVRPPKPERPAWAQQLTTQVSHSHVLLEARISLNALTLGEVARLQKGDVLAFDDESGVRTLLSAGGKDLFWCEFGKAGNRYTVRVQEPHRHEHELMKDLATG